MGLFLVFRSSLVSMTTQNMSLIPATIDYCLVVFNDMSWYDWVLCGCLLDVCIYVVECKHNYVNYCTYLLVIVEMCSSKWELMLMRLNAWMIIVRCEVVNIVVMLSLHYCMSYIIYCCCCKRGESWVQMLGLMTCPKLIRGGLKLICWGSGSFSLIFEQILTSLTFW